MTDTQLTIIVAAIPATIAAISSLLNRGANARTEATVSKMDTKVEVVAAHVNSKATADNAKIEALQKQNADLLVLLAEKKETAALLAQSAAIVAVVPTAVSGVERAAPVEPVEVKIVNPPTEPVPTKTVKQP